MARKVALADPVVPAVMDPDDPTGLVRTGTQENDLEVQVSRWVNLPPDGETDTLELYWGTPAELVDSETFTGPVDPSRFPATLHIPKLYLQPDGAYPLFYRVRSFSSVADDSNTRTITIDTRPPSYDKQLEALLLPDDMALGVINEAYLRAHGGIVELRVPKPIYLGAKAGDVVSLFWSQDYPPSIPALKTRDVTQDDLDSEDIRIELLEAEIREFGKDGAFYLSYKVRDRAFNETTFSLQTRVFVYLLPGGGDYSEPEFPEADKWGYYNCEQKPWEGIKVRIPLDAGFDVQDSITLYWQGYETLNGLQPIAGTEGKFQDTVNATDLRNGYLDFQVPYKDTIEPITHGSATAAYFVMKFTGQQGFSKLDVVKINRKLPGGGFCEPGWEP